MKRRAFLQRAGVALTAMGVSEAGLLGLCDRYYQALAQTSSRKLALLVGINQYPQWPALAGCVTDVELQQELLIYRFGFRPQDILLLTDGQATRQNIEAAFVEHLIRQAKSGDVVVFHFSGYGSQLEMIGESPLPPEKETIIQNRKSKIQNSLVPADAVVSTKGVAGVNVLLEETLLLLLRSLNTDKVTTILDTSFADPSTMGIIPPLLGNLRVRSRPPLPAEQLNAEALALQAQLRQNPKIRSNESGFYNSKLNPPIPGQLLAASGSNQIATETQWNGFSAGLFTYALTQSLWQATPATTVQVSLSRAAGMVKQVAGNRQQPLLIGSFTQQQPWLTYHILLDPQTSAEGVVMAVEDIGKTGLLWLGGLPATVLEVYGVNSLLNVVPLPGADTDMMLPPLQIRSREGAKAKARIASTSATETYPSLRVGQLVRETIRVLPRNINLAVALDTSLERIERVDATSAFSNIPNVVPAIAGEQPADCVFGRVLSSGDAGSRKPGDSNASAPLPLSAYGLFSLGRELIPNTAGEAGEAVKTAMYRLTPKLHSQLAAKLLRLTANEGSSRLGVKVTLEMIAPTAQILLQRMTQRAPWPAPTSRSASPALKDVQILTVPMGSQLQYRLDNYSDRPVYFIPIGIDSNQNAIALYSQKTAPLETRPPLTNEVILPGETLTVPQTSSPFKWIVQGPPGPVEIHFIFSRAPLTQTLTALETINHPRGNSQRIGPVLNPLEVARAILQDLHQASSSTTETIATSPDTFALDVNAWATLSFLYQVV
jgi:Caspase domain/Domain of unknown function (DUF4384)